MADVPNDELRRHPDQLTGEDFADAHQTAEPLSGDRLAEIEQFLDLWDAAPSQRFQYRDVISSQLSGDLERGRKLRATALRGLLGELKRLRDQPAAASVWWVKGDDVFPADPDLHATERAAKDDAIRIYRDANQIDLFGDPVPDFAWRPDRDGGVELYADGTATGLIVRELAVKPPCEHAFPAPTGDANPNAEGYGPGNCTGCGMTYRQYDAGHGERMAEALEGGA